MENLIPPRRCAGTRGFNNYMVYSPVRPPVWRLWTGAACQSSASWARRIDAVAGYTFLNPGAGRMNFLCLPFITDNSKVPNPVTAAGDFHFDWGRVALPL